MSEAAEVDKTTKRERGAEPKGAPALLLFLALVTCHSSLLFGQRFSHVQGAMVQVTSAWTSSPFTLILASNPAHGDLVVVAFASIGCTNGGPSPVTIKDANGNSYAVISTPATLSQAVTSGLCSGGTVYANLWLGYLLNAPSNASGTINVSWPSGQAMGDVWADEFSAAGGSVTFDASASVSSGTASGTALSSPSIPPSLPNEMLYGAAVPPELAPPNGSACPMTAPAAGRCPRGSRGAPGLLGRSREAGEVRGDRAGKLHARPFASEARTAADAEHAGCELHPSDAPGDGAELLPERQLELGDAAAGGLAAEGVQQPAHHQRGADDDAKAANQKGRHRLV